MLADRPLFVLLHSPLVGPLTWRPVAARLEALGFEAIIPLLEDDSRSNAPFWRQHAAAVAGRLAEFPATRPLVFVAHSGAGPLLPAVRQAMAGYQAGAYLFVDAGIPSDGASRLDLMREEDPLWADRFAAELRAGGRFPTWSEADLGQIVPDDALRRQLVAEIRPRALPFFTEPIPVFGGWPDAPGAYLRFTSSYQAPAARARTAGWPLRELDAGHFHMLVDPSAVAGLLLSLWQEGAA